MERKTVNILGINFISLSARDILVFIQEHIEAKKALKICYLDDKQFLKAILSSQIKDNLSYFDIIIPRSHFLVQQIKKIYPDYPYKDEDCLDLLSPIFEKNKNSNHNFMVFGSNSAGMNKLSINLQASFVGLKVMGCYATDFIKARTDAVREMIRKGDVRVIYLGMTTPLDEEWVIQNQDVLNSTLCICVNKEIEVLTGETKEVPLDYRRSGKEFFYLLTRNWLRIFTLWRFIVLRWYLFIFRWRFKKNIEQSK